MATNMADRLGDWTPEELEEAGRQVMATIADYYRHIGEIPVATDIHAADLWQLLDTPLPEQPTDFAQILAETREKVIPHLTHWNHPNFFAYFSACSSGPGIVADALISALNVNLLNWKTSPAGSALDAVALRWLAEMVGYQTDADAVLVNGASLATFYALAAAREETGYNIREEGTIGRDLPVLRCYATEHAHSSIDKAVIALGVGLKNLVKIPGDGQQRMRVDLLEAAIAADVARGYKPFACVAVAGTTSTGAADPIEAVAAVCRKYGIWLHVDGAYGGLYNVVPEIAAQVDDFKVADSLVINPHKVMFTPLEVTALYSNRKGKLAAAFSLVPEYLRTEPEEGTVDFHDYTLQLGRSFRGLKLWWVIRTFGREGIARRMAEHRRLALALTASLAEHPDFVVVGGSPYPLVCFRAFPRDLQAEFATAAPERRQALRIYVDRLNMATMERVNADREFFITHSGLADGYILRVAIGNIRAMEEHVTALWEKIQRSAAEADAALRPTLA
jgi:aromatic-L-amino-acid decarboxylase